MFNLNGFPKNSDLTNGKCVLSVEKKKTKLSKNEIKQKANKNGDEREREREKKTFRNDVWSAKIVEIFEIFLFIWSVACHHFVVVVVVLVSVLWKQEWI